MFAIKVTNKFITTLFNSIWLHRTKPCMHKVVVGECSETYLFPYHSLIFEHRIYLQHTHIDI